MTISGLTTQTRPHKHKAHSHPLDDTRKTDISDKTLKSVDQVLPGLTLLQLLLNLTINFLQSGQGVGFGVVDLPSGGKGLDY